MESRRKTAIAAADIFSITLTSLLAASQYAWRGKCELVGGPALPDEELMRTDLAFDAPANPFEGGQYTLGFSCWPVAH